MSSNQPIGNRFELQDLVGRGGMGGVYRALDTQTGETVTAKALNPDARADDTNIHESGRTGTALCHHGVCRGGKHVRVAQQMTLSEDLAIEIIE